MADDYRLLVAALADNAESVCRRYLSAGRRIGRYWTVGDARNTPGRSMWVRLEPDARGRPAGKWVDAATGEHGDLLDIIREVCSFSTFGDTLNEAKRFIGMPHSTDHIGPQPKELDQASSTRASRLFTAAQPLAQTLGAHYLAARGLSGLGPLSALRFHPQCFYQPEDGPHYALPAIVAAATGIDGCIAGIQRTYLDIAGFTPETLGKAPVDTPRKALGDLLGNAVRFGTPDHVLLAGEGIESVLSVRVAAPDLPLAAALSAGNLAAMTIPVGLRRLYVLRDNDTGGRWATLRLMDRAQAHGVEAIPLVPICNDLNDDLRRFGSSSILEVLRCRFLAEDRARYLSLQPA
jgi:hypothetical protein